MGKARSLLLLVCPGETETQGEHESAELSAVDRRKAMQGVQV